MDDQRKAAEEEFWCSSCGRAKVARDGDWCGPCELADEDQMFEDRDMGDS